MSELLIIDNYNKLINSFINGNISAEEFDLKYLDLFLNDKTSYSQKLYDITQELFYDVEEFCIYPELREEGEIDEDGLLNSAKIALKRLEEYKLELEKES